jgi:hypothetical protein
MRIRILASATAIALAIGLLSALPATAAYTVESITFPGGQSEFYSPFGGPATIEFGFLGTEPNATFNVRIRPAGGSAIHTKDVFVTPDEPGGIETETFSWPAITVSSPRTYVVAVYRFGNEVAKQSFFLRPRLARITDITPDPFLPWIDDGHRDTTNVKFTLQADADAEARVFKANAAGRCCGALVLDQDLGHLSEGANTWVWDGQGEGEHGTAGNRPKGKYFVRIWADTGVVAPGISRPFEVSIARTYRATATKSKPAKQYHHRSAATPLVIAGNCYVTVLVSNLRVLCQGARITVYWRWGLNDSQRIEHASFTYDPDGATCPSSIRRVAHTRHQSSFTMHEDLVGSLGLCYLVTARITYSFPKAS